MGEVEVELDWGEILAKSKKRALGGGMAGACAMVVQVTTLMWMRTTMNYQYRYGTTLPEALSTLYAQGGVRRFYRGYGPALLQGPLARFGDTAANTGMLTLLNAHPKTRDLASPVKSFFASIGAASWRIVLMPIDTLKTTMQVEGKEGIAKLGSKMKAGGPFVLWHGAGAACGATFVGHFPWFATYNALDANFPAPEDGSLFQKLGRRAAMGFCSSVISDCCSNSIRVCKTFKQTSDVPITYPEVIRTVVAKEGVFGMMTRGLKTRIIANGVNGIMFSVMWKFFEDKLLDKDK